MADRFETRARRTALSALFLAAGFQTHAEILVGRDASGKLAVTFDSSKSHPLPASRFAGIEGYADALPGFMSLIEAKPGETLLPPDPESNIVFVLLHVDEGITVWNDRGTRPMRIGETFTLGHPPFDSHPVWNIVRGESGKRYALKMQMDDTSGRYRESDAFSASFTPDDATELYACPMRCGGGTTYTKAGICSVCDMQLKLISAKSYRVTVAPEAPPGEDGRLRARHASKLRFKMESPDAKPVRDFELVHEKLLHLLMVSDDLSWFAHEHPEIQPDGSFVLEYAFPHGGRFTLYNDFTLPRVGMQVVPVELDVVGDAPAPVPLRVDADEAQRVDGYVVTLNVAKPIKCVQMQSLTMHVARDGAPVSDLEPFLGALGHLIVVSADRKQFVHSHPLEPAKVGARPAARTGPTVTFNAQFPSPGVYKAWGQFQHKGHVITAPFVIDVVSPVVELEAASRDAASGRDDR